jgi:hypothetical protein
MKQKFTSTENVNKVFASLTEFRRCSEQSELKANAIVKFFKKNDISRNYFVSLKDELLHRRLINNEFNKWNTHMSAPTYEMAESVAKAAAKRLTEYQRSCKEKRDNRAIKGDAEIIIKSPKKQTLLKDATLQELVDAIRELLPINTELKIKK